MKGAFFITGIGTEIGKTLVTATLVHQLRRKNIRARALKPVLSGYDESDPHNDSAVLLRAQGMEVTPETVETISPWRFRAPLSPHLAAAAEHKALDVEAINAWCEARLAQADITLIEGAGGVMTPLTERATNRELIARLRIPAVLVAGTYLGAISHTLCTLAALREANIRIQAIVISQSMECAGLDAIMETLRGFMPDATPLIALPRLADTQERWQNAPDLGSIISV